MLQKIALGEIAICWLAWSLGFVSAMAGAGKEKVVAKEPLSMWGVVLSAAGVACLFVYTDQEGHAKPAAALAAAMVLAPLSVGLAWASVHALGRHWRFGAALIENHKLITTGPYNRLRHPIYASMLGMMLATGLGYSSWGMLALGMVLGVVGVELRVDAEERLLAGRFQDIFFEYKGRTKAYIPFIR